jgi:signal transduction histidine kinase
MQNVRLSEPCEERATLWSGPNVLHTAAWRVAFWNTLAFGAGTALVFWFLQVNIATSVVKWNEVWLTSESAAITEILNQYAERPGQAASHAFLELLTSQFNRNHSSPIPMNTVFAIVRGGDGLQKASAGLKDPGPFLKSAQAVRVGQLKPQSVNVPGADAPFLVLARNVGGDVVYFGFSECISSNVLGALRALLAASWTAMLAIGFCISFLSARRTLGRVQNVTETARAIGQNNLSARVPEGQHTDEIGRLTLTFNRMLDRIEDCVYQVHTMTDSLAHDLKSPITAMRAKLELELSAESDRCPQSVVHALEELDRLSEFLNQYLDVAEARAGALRLWLRPLDLTAIVSDMVELYQPAFVDKGMRIELNHSKPVVVSADVQLIQRMLANLLDNELNHVPTGCRVAVTVTERGVVVVQDDGPGFPDELRSQIFDRFAKGTFSSGRGLGLAFVHAVMSAHGGTARAGVGSAGGASISLHFAPHQARSNSGLIDPVALAASC